jgi:RimJ/RimL family protein N-acetyltransferase
MINLANPKDISVRFLEEGDIPALAQYFFESPPGFIESLGFDLKKFGTKEEFLQNYKRRLKDLQENGEKPKSIIVLFEDKRIGMHSSTHSIPRESLVMHAHFFDPTFRGRGIGPISSIKAAELFFEEFELKKIIVKIPLQNKAPLRLMEKLGIMPIGNEIIDAPLFKKPMEAKVFHADFEDLQRLKKDLKIC